jgi:hypothetical protein
MLINNKQISFGIHGLDHKTEENLKLWKFNTESITLGTTKSNTK